MNENFYGLFLSCVIISRNIDYRFWSMSANFLPFIWDKNVTVIQILPCISPYVPTYVHMSMTSIIVQCKWNLCKFVFTIRYVLSLNAYQTWIGMHKKVISKIHIIFSPNFPPKIYIYRTRFKSICTYGVVQYECVVILKPIFHIWERMVNT